MCTSMKILEYLKEKFTLIFFFFFFFFSWETYPGLVSQVLNDKAWLFEMWITLSTG